MTRAHPADLRDAIMMAQSFVKAGVLFVPIPVLDADDAQRLGVMALERIEKMEGTAKGESDE